MDYRNLFGIAAIILSGAVFLHSLKSANASMPVGMQHGQFPYEHFTVCDLPGVNVNSTDDCYMSTGGIYTLLTVPTDRIFVVTGGVNRYRTHCWFLNDGDLLYPKALMEEDKIGPLTTGNAHIVLPAGSTLQVNIPANQAGACNFYIEGYYAHN